MRIHRGPGVDATILGAATLFALALGNGNNLMGAPERYDFVAPRAAVTEDVSTTALVGTWRSPDAAVHLDLYADGDYDRGIVGRTSISHGSYVADGPNLVLCDDSGLRTTVIVADGALEMAGHRLRKL
jgi:putative ligand-binding protein with streptavidin-like fold